ncbi:unnamed protein product [Calypogeia fissa]
MNGARGRMTEGYEFTTVELRNGWWTLNTKMIATSHGSSIPSQSDAKMQHLTDILDYGSALQAATVS